MNLINNTIISQNLTLLSGWVDSTPVPKMIDTVTYDLYESDNPFRNKFSENQIKNDRLRNSLNTAASAGAEVFSAFANPYYLVHKAVQIPAACNSVVDTYKKYSGNS